ncbi:unnamed protein product [Cochlearia groenlandica]
MVQRFVDRWDGHNNWSSWRLLQRHAEAVCGPPRSISANLQSSHLCVSFGGLYWRTLKTGYGPPSINKVTRPVIQIMKERMKMQQEAAERLGVEATSGG